MCKGRYERMHARVHAAGMRAKRLSCVPASVPARRAACAGGVGPWVMSAARAPDLLSLNKEGLGSCMGYWALHLWGAAIAHALHASAVHILPGGPCGGGQEGLDRVSGGDRAGRSAVGDAAGSTAPAGGDQRRRLRLHQGHHTGGELDASQLGKEMDDGAGGGGTVAVAPSAHGRARCRCRARLLAWLALVGGVDVALWLCLWAMEAWIEPVSRR